MGNLNEHIINRYLKGNCSEEDLTKVNNWIKESDENARKFFGMEEVYHLGKYARYADEQRMMLAEKRLDERNRQEQKKQGKVLHLRRWMSYVAAIAMVALLGGAAGYWSYQQETGTQLLTATANEGIVKEVALPDGTKVWLNNSATLKYPRVFSEKERKVSLNGEAYFEVTKNHRQPFIVESDAMQVRVLGTTFNLKCAKQAQIAEVTLLEGKIEVKGNRNEGHLILTPGQRAELNKHSGQLTVKQVDAKLDAVWHNDLIPFEKAEIFTIAQTLERFYHVKIILAPDIQADKTYSGVLKKRATIDSVLQSLQNSIPINYKIVGDNIFISSKP